MGRKKLKPEYDPERIQSEMIIIKSNKKQHMVLFYQELRLKTWQKENTRKKYIQRIYARRLRKMR